LRTLPGVEEQGPPYESTGWVGVHRMSCADLVLFKLRRVPGLVSLVAFLDCSVPGTRGRLGRLLRPGLGRSAHPPQ
jgi:hypothetical protein